MARWHRFTFRLLEIFDYRTFITAGAFLSLLLVGYLVVTSVQTAQDSKDLLEGQRAAATRRIDLLTTELRRLQALAQDNSRTNGEQAEAIAALTEQIKQLGGRPVVTGPSQDPVPNAPASPGGAPSTELNVLPSPQVSPSASPPPSTRSSPQPSATPTASSSPSPSESPSVTVCLPLVGCL